MSISRRKVLLGSAGALGAASLPFSKFAFAQAEPIKIGAVTVATVTNGQRAGGPANAQAKEVAPGQRGLLADVSGTWKEGTNNWSLDVVVTSGRGETYTSRANWR
jgi:hypothetical protein